MPLNLIKTDWEFVGVLHYNIVETMQMHDSSFRSMNKHAKNALPQLNLRDCDKQWIVYNVFWQQLDWKLWK